MSSYLDEQLKKLNLPIGQKEIFVQRKVAIPLVEDYTYILKLSDNIFLDNYRKDIKDNFNNGTKPKNKFYKADISKISGNMIKINGVGYDYENDTELSSYWSGWLIIQDIEVLRKI